MPLKKTTIAKLAKLAKVEEKAITDAIAATDEVEVAIADDLEVFTTAELTTRDRNKYDTGKTAGTEMAIKDLKTKAKVTIDGVDPEKIVEAIATKAVADAKIDPGEQVKEANKLVDQWKTKATTAEQRAVQLESQTTQLARDSKLRGYFPKNRIDSLDDDDFLGNINRRYDFQVKDGVEVAVDRQTGEIVRDPKELKPIAPAKVVEGYFTERRWINTTPPPRPGPGGGNSNPGGGLPKFSKMSEVNKYVLDKGLNNLGGEGLAIIKAAAKENPDMDMNT